MKEYHYTECGLDNIYLLNGFEITETYDGEEVFIHNIHGLQKVIGMILVSKPGLLVGNEIRFIRHAFDWSQKKLAHLLGVDYQTILRWEKDKGKISKTADSFIKILFFSYLNPEENLDICARSKTLFLKSLVKAMILTSYRVFYLYLSGINSLYWLLIFY